MTLETKERVVRRLAAIMAADVVGYSRLMGTDEEGTLDQLRTLRAKVIDPAITKNHGRIVKTTGDGLLVEFTSVVDALRCGIEFQRNIANTNQTVSSDQRIEFRIGIHQGDVVVEHDDIFGDGVNVAARLESVADPGGICVSSRVQEDTVGKFDLGFDDLGDHHLKNIARIVRVYRVRFAEGPTTPPRLSAGPFDRPSIAVLPFQNMSGDREQDYFADGMVEDIITALSRIRWLFVTARNSSFTYKGQAVDVKRVGRELGVRYVLEGSVRKAGSRIRITAQLIEAETDAHLWADHIDGTLDDVFDLQDKVASRVAGVIEPTLQAAEIIRTSRRPTKDLTAYDLYLRAFSKFLSPARNVPEVLRLLDEVIERDPAYGNALAWAAVCHFLCDANNWSDDYEANRRMGIDRGHRALLVAGDDPAILANASLALGYFGEDIDVMTGLSDRALALNPNFARGWHANGLLRLWAGQPDCAIKHVENSMRLSPRARVGWGVTVIGWCHFIAGRFDEALPYLRLALKEDPMPNMHLGLAACCAQAGRLDEAHATLARLPVTQRGVTPSHAAVYRNSAHRELFLSGLRLAAGASL